MATVNIPAPKTLNINDKSASSLWKYWKKTWERFEIATGIDEAGDKKRVCTLLYIIGEDAVKVFDTFEYGDGQSEDSIHDMLNILRNIVTLDEIQYMSGISSSVATRRLVNPDRATLQNCVSQPTAVILRQIRQAKFCAIDLYMVCMMPRCESDCYGKPISHSTEHMRWFKRPKLQQNKCM